MVNKRIDPYDYQRATNLREHNEIIVKLNEVIDAVNQGGVEVDTYTKGEINAKLLDVVARVEAYTDETAQGKLTPGVGIHISDNNIISADVEPGTEILPFTNFQAGSIVGNVDQDGNIYAVETGIGRVLGWDEMKQRIEDDELAIGAKQNKLTAGTGIKIEDDVISATTEVDAYTKDETDALLLKKQNKLTAGQNISIVNDVISASATIDAYTKAETDTLLAGKQIKLIPGTGISLDAQGNISATGQIDAYTKAETDSLLAQKQATLRSGINIKSINNTSILGAGNISIEGGTVDPSLSPTSTNAIQNRAVYNALQDKQDKLISGSNIKSIGGTSLLGSGSIGLTYDSQIVNDEIFMNIGLGGSIVGVRKPLLEVVPVTMTVDPESNTSEGSCSFGRTYTNPPYVIPFCVTNNKPDHPVVVTSVGTGGAAFYSTSNVSSLGSVYALVIGKGGVL